MYGLERNENPCEEMQTLRKKQKKGASDCQPEGKQSVQRMQESLQHHHHHYLEKAKKVKELERHRVRLPIKQA